MIRHPGVAIVALLCATVTVCAALSGIVFLAYTGNGTEAVGGLVLGLVGLVLGKLGAVQRQTNGHMTRVLDAALPPPADQVKNQEDHVMGGEVRP